MPQYSETFKAGMVRRMVGPEGLSANALSQQLGGLPHQTTLSEWRRQTTGEETMGSSKLKKSRRPQDWTAGEKLEVVLEAASLPEEQLGAFLRGRGLHQAHLDQWREQMLQGLASPRKSKKSPETRRIAELERDLKRKDAALAEASALLILKKKAQAIWGDVGEDMMGRSEK